MAFLEIASGSQQGLRLEIDRNEVVIGRARENALALDDPSASSRHCAVIRDGARYTLRDLGSTNGTSLNGEPVRTSRLSPKDIITVGSVDIIFDGTDVEVPTEEIPLTGSETLVLPSSHQTPSAFGTRRNSMTLWFVVAGVVVVSALSVLAYVFLTRLFHP